MQSSVAAFFSWKSKENKYFKFDDNFNTSNMTWTGHWADPKLFSSGESISNWRIYYFFFFFKLDSHRKGVLSVAWSSVDSDLLLSCGKDNRIICWNPNSNQEGGEVLCELVDSNQWSFNVAWCPRNPALIAATSFDNRVSVYSLMGGQQQVNITGQCFSEPKFEIVIQSWPL